MHPKVTRQAGRGLGAMLTAMRFSSHPAALAPYRDLLTIRLRQIAENHTIGNLAADAGLLALVLERHLDGKPDCSAGTGLRDSRAWRSATCRALIASARSQKTDRTFMCKLWAPHTPAPGQWPCVRPI